jgi:hypothetical protein
MRTAKQMNIEADHALTKVIYGRADNILRNELPSVAGLKPEEIAIVNEALVSIFDDRLFSGLDLKEAGLL